jgi:hypothetical protein
MIIACGETVCFILIIIFGVQLIFFLLANPLETMLDLFNIPLLYGVSISVILFIFISPFTRWLLSYIESQSSLFRMRNLEIKLLQMLEATRQISISACSKEFKIDIDDIKVKLENLMHKGVIRGLITKKNNEEIYELTPDFNIQTEHERHYQNFRTNIEPFLKAYKWIPLDKIAKIFELSLPEVETELQQLIGNKKLQGYIDGNNFVHQLEALLDLNSTREDLEPCPFCNGNNLPNAMYCSRCGKNLLDE